MPWPTNIDYQEAIQNTKLCFDNAELRAGTVETKLGLPVPRSGNFASVYKIQCANRTFAVRCFLRELDQRYRYEQISKHLQSANLSCMAGFGFIQRGIFVRGHWYPILKMEWIQGELLLEYIKRNIKSPSKCAELAKQWLVLCKDLQANGVAHGDFQHGNIIVVNGQLKLIDYDGMYVPALANSVSHEVGHPNYQHPHRMSNHFGPYLDNFSAWVVYLSLVALSLDSSLWSTTNAGDECLLFRKEDFENPEGSRVFAALERHSNLQIQTLAILFRNLLYIEPEQVPSLDGQVPGIQHEQQSSSLWISDYVSTNASVQGTPVVPQKSGIPEYDATWVLDFVDNAKEPVEKVNFPASLLQLRLLAFASLSGVVAFGISMWLSKDSLSQFGWFLLLGFLVPVNIIVMRSKYKNDPVILARDKALAALNDEKHNADSLREALAKLQKQKQVFKKEEDDSLAAIQSRVAETHLMENRDTNSVQSQLNCALSDISRRRNQVQTERDSALGAIRTTCQSEINRLDKELMVLPQVEAQELSDTLISLQRQYINEHLKQFRISGASIKGVGESFTRSLMVSGFSTAADIDYYRVQNVSGIGPTRAQALADWRKRVENFAKAKMPQKLPSSTKAAISARFVQKRQQLEKDKSQWEAKLQAESNHVSIEANNKLQVIEKEQRATQTTADKRLVDLKRQYTDKIATPTNELATVKKSYSIKYAELEGNIRHRTQEVCQQNWRAAKASRQVDRYSNINVSTLMKRVFLFR